MKKNNPAVLVHEYASEDNNEVVVRQFIDAELHISTHGVLVIRRPNNGKAICAYSAGTWHKAEAALA